MAFHDFTLILGFIVLPQVITRFSQTRERDATSFAIGREITVLWIAGYSRASRASASASSSSCLPQQACSRCVPASGQLRLQRRDARLHIPASCTSAITTERETANVS